MVSTVDRGVLLIHRFVVGLAVIVSCGAALAEWSAMSFLWLLLALGMAISSIRPRVSIAIVFALFLILNAQGLNGYALNAVSALFICCLAVLGFVRTGLVGIFLVGYVPLVFVLFPSWAEPGEPFSTSLFAASTTVMGIAGLLWVLGFGLHATVKRSTDVRREQEESLREYLHDNVGNPLSIATLGAQLAAAQHGDSGQLKLVTQEVQRAAEALSHIASQAGKGRRRTIRGAAMEWADKMHACGLSPSVSLESSAGISEVHKTVLLRAMDELCSNVIRNSEKGAVVSLKLESNRSTHALTVSNELSSLGHPAGVSGMGIGLDNLEKVVRAHGGTMVVKREAHQWVSEIRLEHEGSGEIGHGNITAYRGR